MTERIAGTLDVAAGYLRWAADYDRAVNPTRDAAAALLRAQDFGRVERAVDLGCGTGGNTGWLAGFCASVLAFDGSAAMLDVARQKPMPAHVAFRQADLLEPLPLAAASIEVVVETLVLEHVSALGPVFAEVARVLRPGGTFFVCELHPFRQAEGKQARVGAADTIEAYRHTISDYLNAGVAAGLACRRMDEPASEPGRPPRVVGMRFVKTPP